MSPQPKLSDDGAILTVHIPFAIEKHGCHKRIITPDGSNWQAPQTNVESVLTKAIARAHRWKRMLDTGEYSTLQELAAHEKINKSYLSRVLRLTLLTPTIIEAIMDGRQSPTLELNELLKPFPLEWSEQEELFLNRG